jgi:hypothetical protein
MKKTLILFLLAASALCNSYSQGFSYSERNQSETLTISELTESNPYQGTFNTNPIPQGTDSILMIKHRYYYQGKPIKTVMEINKIMKPNREAFTKNQTAWAFQFMGAPFAVIGGALMGFGLATDDFDKKTKTKIILIGASGAVVGISLALVSDKLRRDAIKIYNRDLGKTSFYPEKELKIKLMANGIGVNYRF